MNLKSSIINLFRKSVYSFGTYSSVLLFKIVYTSIFHEWLDIAIYVPKTAPVLNR